MPSEVRILHCCNCSVYQAEIYRGAMKWECRMCNEKQAVKEEIFRGNGAEARVKIIELNTANGKLTTDDPREKLRITMRNNPDAIDWNEVTEYERISNDALREALAGNFAPEPPAPPPLCLDTTHKVICFIAETENENNRNLARLRKKCDSNEDPREAELPYPKYLAMMAARQRLAPRPTPRPTPRHRACPYAASSHNNKWGRYM